MVLLHKSRKVIEESQVIINDWLRSMGLQLKDSKTKMAHTLGDGKVQTGFDYLGFNVRQYPVKDINCDTDRDKTASTSMSRQTKKGDYVLLVLYY